MLDPNTYDEVPYPSYPYSFTHPDHLSTIAWLLGLDVPRKPYRVLELGCASGGNLIPMAAWNPECQFMGIDLSGAQISQGNRLLQQLGLRNITLQQASILDFDLTPASFDFIICHGVYSWVPPVVQAKILEIYRVCLSKLGVGLISYNTHPGWRQRGALRDMMRYHVERNGASEPSVRIQQARDLIQFLVQATFHSDSSYAKMLKEQLQLLQGHSDSYLFHEHLEENNEPIWFSNFCARLAQCDLRYLGEAEFGSMVGCLSLEAELQQQLDQIAPNLVEQEQYMDFVRNRAFRQTLVCHADRSPNYQVRGSRLDQLFCASPGQIVPQDETHEPRNWCVSLANGLSIETSVRSTQIAFELLSQAWPQRIEVQQLTKEVRHQLAPDLPVSDLENSVAVALLTAFVSGRGLLELAIESHLAPFGLIDPERPATNQLVRIQAKDGDFVTNWRHQAVQIMPIDRRILPMLDGKTNVQSINAALRLQFVSGQLTITDEQDQPIQDINAIDQMLPMLIQQRLAFYGRSSLISI